VNEITLRAVSKYLNETECNFLSLDFTEVFKDIPSKSFVYFDPPYDPVSDSSSFTGYTMNGF
jgi:DNA adenine methylase